MTNVLQHVSPVSQKAHLRVIRVAEFSACDAALCVHPVQSSTCSCHPTDEAAMMPAALV